MTLKSDAKFEEKQTCGLQNDSRNFVNFHRSTRKSQIQSRKCTSLKFTEELCVFEEELTYHFKIDMRNLTNFDPSLKNLHFNALFLTKVYNV